MMPEEWSLTCYRGALEAAERELERFERGLGVPDGARTALRGQLGPWRMLVEQLERHGGCMDGD